MNEKEKFLRDFFEIFNEIDPHAKIDFDTMDDDDRNQAYQMADKMLLRGWTLIVVKK